MPSRDGGSDSSSRRKSRRNRSKPRSGGSTDSAHSGSSDPKRKKDRSSRRWKKGRSKDSPGRSSSRAKPPAPGDVVAVSSDNPDHGDDGTGRRSRGKKKHWYSRRSKKDSKNRKYKFSKSRSRSRRKDKSKDSEERSGAVKLCANCFRRKNRRKKKHFSKDKHGKHRKGDKSDRPAGDGHALEAAESDLGEEPTKRHWWQRKKKRRSDRRKRGRRQKGDAAGDGDGKGDKSAKRRSGSRSSMKSRSSDRGASAGPSESASYDSKKVKFNESVRVQEIPHMDAPHQNAAHGVVSHGSQVHGHPSTESGHSGASGGGLHEITASSSDQDIHHDLHGDLHHDDSLLDPEHEHDYPAGALGSCPAQGHDTQSLKSNSPDPETCSVKSIKSVMLDDNAHIFDPSKKYTRRELICMMEKLVSGINNRESLKSRYDEQITRLAISNEYKTDKVEQTKQKLNCLMQEQKSLDTALKDSADKLSRNYLQLTRERKRIAGAVDLREDFDKFLQLQISTKTKFVQDYAQILGKLESLVDDSSLQWVQRETMISTEAEALERVHRSAEKELQTLQADLGKHKALFATREAQNKKLSQVVEEELKKYSKKQQDILKFNEKRIRALEGCIRTMQLDREVMYGEIAENRYRLKEVVEGRIRALMDKVHQYKDIIKSLRDEIDPLLNNCKLDSIALLRASPALNTYTKLIAALDLPDLEEKVKTAKANCDKAEAAFKKKNSQKKDLTEIRRSYVDGQRRDMLSSEQEYFLMEPVEVPGMESVTNFQRSLDDFTNGAYRFASGAATAPTAQWNAGGTTDKSNEPRASGAAPSHDARSSRVTEDFVSTGNTERFGENDLTEDLDHMQMLQQSYKEEIKQGPLGGNRRRSVLQTLSVSPKNAAQSVGNAFKKIGQNMSMKKDHSMDP